MSKNKRRIASTQRDKIAIQVAKELKKAGILSKQANLHSGKYISRGVLQKVKEYRAAADLGYKAVTVSKATAKAAKERGYQVVQGNRIIGPATPQFRNRLKAGALTGVKPVRGGLMEEVTLPHTVMDMHSLVAQLEDGIDTLKLPDEYFAFKYKGAESYRAFMNTDDLLEYLKHYKGIFSPNGSLKAEDLQEEFDALTIFRLHRHDIRANIRGPGRRPKAPSSNRNRKSLAEKLETMHPDRAARIRKKMAAKSAAQREARMANPVALERYKEKARVRAAKSYRNRKGK